MNSSEQKGDGRDGPVSIHLGLVSERVKVLVIQSYLTRNPILQPSRLLCPWNSLVKSTGVGSQSLLQGICPTQGSNLGLLHCRQIFTICLSHQGGCLIRMIREQWASLCGPCYLHWGHLFLASGLKSTTSLVFAYTHMQSIWVANTQPIDFLQKLCFHSFPIQKYLLPTTCPF